LRTERILKAAREKQQVTYKGKPIRTVADFLTEALKAWKDMFQALKENNYQLVLTFSAKLFFIIEGEVRTFHDKQK
jgi:chromatin segregation and condensation protein Rec8/ScpA/Scc1 (kleisin family)